MRQVHGNEKAVPITIARAPFCVNHVAATLFASNWLHGGTVFLRNRGKINVHKVVVHGGPQIHHGLTMTGKVSEKLLGAADAIVA